MVKKTKKPQNKTKKKSKKIKKRKSHFEKTANQILKNFFFFNFFTIFAPIKSEWIWSTFSQQRSKAIRVSEEGFSCWRITDRNMILNPAILGFQPLTRKFPQFKGRAASVITRVQLILWCLGWGWCCWM